MACKTIFRMSSLEGIRIGYFASCSWKKKRPSLSEMIGYIRSEIKKDREGCIEYILRGKNNKIIIHDIHDKTR